MTPSVLGTFAFTPFFLVGLGGAGGAVARYLVGTYVERTTVDTLAVNVLGSFVLGALVAVPSLDPVGPTSLAVGVGFCGAFTTFSSFAVETVRLAETGKPRRAIVNAVGTLVAALLAVALGAAVVAVLLE
ncbi:fluoride efflux transporter CrcB [Halobacteria archaeon HArc-gm2]|nr:fluoride efflux transporter CrcB [Halobacteria archaeon HArc-gm2]